MFMTENNFGAVANFKREIVLGARKCANLGTNQQGLFKSPTNILMKSCLQTARFSSVQYYFYIRDKVKNA